MKRSFCTVLGGVEPVGKSLWAIQDSWYTVPAVPHGVQSMLGVEHRGFAPGAAKLQRSGVSVAQPNIEIQDVAGTPCTTSASTRVARVAPTSPTDQDSKRIRAADRHDGRQPLPPPSGSRVGTAPDFSPSTTARPWSRRETVGYSICNFLRFCRIFIHTRSVSAAPRREFRCCRTSPSGLCWTLILLPRRGWIGRTPAWTPD